MGERRVVYRVLIVKPEGKRPIEQDNNKMILQELWFGGMDWIDLGQDRDWWWALVNAVMNLGVL